jgi:predicted nucleotidyltransferase
MDSNLKQLLSALNANSVKYVIIGGYAVFIHAQPRATKDLDVFIESSPANGLATYKALAEFGAPLDAFTVEDFSTPNVAATFGNPPICFDVLQRISGVEFCEVYANSIEVLIDNEIPARYISADDLVRNKLASGRPQDLADAAAVLQKQRAKEKAGR